MPRPHPITTGDRFGRLTALETINPVRYPGGTVGTMRECRCDCGTIKFFTTGSLRSGNAKSCGCLRSELTSKRSLRHGHKIRNTRIYRIWAGMLTRCSNPNVHMFRYYGARGIKVCQRWHNFENFLADMGEPPEGHSIDRLNNEGDYEPTNCAWRSRTEQCRNRRSNVFWSYNGHTKTLAEWAEIVGITAGTLVSRIGSGWTIEEALTIPKLRGSQTRSSHRKLTF